MGDNKRFAVAVEATVMTMVYVSAPDAETAKADALVIARTNAKYEDMFRDADYDAIPMGIERWPLGDPEDDTYWTGGPGGEWREFTEDIDPPTEGT